MRSQIGIEKSADAECVARLRSLERRLGKLDSRKVAELLTEDVLEGEMTSMLLLLRILGCQEDAEPEGEPARFARVGIPQREKKEQVKLQTRRRVVST